MDREKIIHSIELEEICAHFFSLKLKTSAGLYVKEFVHGDFGRTSPSLADLIEPGNFNSQKCDILQLDVLQVLEDEYPYD